MRFWKVLLIAAISSGLLASCSAVEKSPTALEQEEEESTEPGVESSPFYLVIKSKYQTAADTTRYTEKTCSIGAADPAGTVLACDLAIPELRLHYSDLKFTVGASTAAGCTLVGFDPYYIVRSYAAAFDSPESTSNVDCSAGDKAACFGGAAKSIITNASATFPDTFGLYFLLANTNQTTYTATSSNMLAQESGADPAYGTNAYVANNLLAADRLTPIAYNTTQRVEFRGLSAGDYSDYRVTCEDEYGLALYTITLTISDKDTPTAEGTSDQFYDWD